MRLRLTLFLIPMCFFLTPTNVCAQLTVNTEASFIIGGKVGYYPRYFRNTLIVRSGGFVNTSLLKPVNEQIFLGGGMGVVLAERETFVPVFAQMRAMLSNNPSGFYFDVKSGYSPGFNSTFNTHENQQYHGGWFVNMTLGYRHIIADNTHFHFGLQWVHQRASLHTEVMTGKHREPLRFHFMGIMSGFTF